MDTAQLVSYVDVLPSPLSSSIFPFPLFVLADGIGFSCRLWPEMSLLIEVMRDSYVVHLVFN